MSKSTEIKFRRFFWIIQSNYHILRCTVPGKENQVLNLKWLALVMSTILKYCKSILFLLNIKASVSQDANFILYFNS